jgi:arylsulfatase A-like enzyme
MKNSPILLLLLILLCASSPKPVLSAAEGRDTQAAQPQPNIVVFLVDDMGIMDTSVPFLTNAKGKPKRYPLNEFYRTPNMERLANQGIRFNNFYAMSVCSPTRASIMTGQTSARHRTTQYIKPESNNAGAFGPPEWHWTGLTDGQVTLPALLAQAGYRTIHCGKAHFGPNDSFAEEPLNLGFEVNIAGCAYGQPGSYYGTENFGHGKKSRVKRAVPGLEKYHGQDIFLTEALTIEMNAAIDDAVNDDKPFYAYMSHYAVHAPFHSDSRFAPHYENSDKPKNAQAFATLIEGMDKSLGDILDHLDQLGVAENTLVFFLGDNGSDAPLGATHEVACAAPLRGKKGTHYEGGMRVPFIAAWAKLNPKNPLQQNLSIPANTIQTQVASVSDLFPTILDLTGAKNPKKHPLSGAPLETLLTGKPDPAREEIFLMHFPHSHRSNYFTSYRKDDWKLIYHYNPKENAPTQELFNLADDPFESENLANTHPEQLTRMITATIEALEAEDAQYPISKDGTPIKPRLP